MGQIIRLGDATKDLATSLLPKKLASGLPTANPLTPAKATCVCEGAGWLWDRQAKTMVECSCGIVGRRRMEVLQEASGWHEAMAEMRLDNLLAMPDRTATADLLQAQKAAKAFVADPQGWIVFAGTWGDGKTHLLAGIANAQPDARPWLYVIARDLWAFLGCVAYSNAEVDYEARMEMVKNVPLLLVDELGAERSSDAVRDRRQRLFDHRYRGRMPTAFATNAWPIDMLYGGGGWEDGWLISRLLDRRFSQVYKLPDVDFRQAA